MVRGIALSLAALLAVFELGACLKCYQCNSAQNPNCGIKFTATDKSIDCGLQDAQNYASTYLRVLNLNLPTAGNRPFCLKVSDPTGGFTRSCMLANNPAELKNFCDSSKTLLKSCEYCEKDYCNASSAITSSLPVAFLALVATYLFYKQ